MVAAVWPHRKAFITPMAAVAGAVADEVLAAMVESCPLKKAYVNDGGDIAWHLQPGERLRAGIVADDDADRRWQMRIANGDARVGGGRPAGAAPQKAEAGGAPDRLGLLEQTRHQRR